MKLLSVILLIALIALFSSAHIAADQDLKAQALAENSEIIKKWVDRRKKIAAKLAKEEALPTPVETVEPAVVPAEETSAATDAAAAVEPAVDELKSKIRKALESHIKPAVTDATDKPSRSALKERIREILRKKLAKRSEKPKRDNIKDKIREKVRRALHKPRRHRRRHGRRFRKGPRRHRKGPRRHNKRRRHRKFSRRFPRNLCKACAFCSKLGEEDLVSRCKDICARKCKKTTKPVEPQPEEEEDVRIAFPRTFRPNLPSPTIPTIPRNYIFDDDEMALNDAATEWYDDDEMALNEAATEWYDDDEFASEEDVRMSFPRRFRPYVPSPTFPTFPRNNIYDDDEIMG